MGWAGTQMSLICYNEAHVLMDWRAAARLICLVGLHGRLQKKNLAGSWNQTELV
jgi:hypothetical protein